MIVIRNQALRLRPCVEDGKGLTQTSSAEVEHLARERCPPVLILCLCGYAALGSLRGTSTENLREWKREDPQRKKLIVFVHGFNSSKKGAWGQFPDLVKDDSDNFDAYNIHLFGYPSKGCRNVNDIQDEGEYPASLSTSEQCRIEKLRR